MGNRLSERLGGRRHLVVMLRGSSAEVNRKGMSARNDRRHIAALPIAAPKWTK